MGEESPSTTSSTLLKALNETSNKISGFIESLNDHLHNEEFDSKKDDLDFLHVKNTMMLSYLIDLAHLLRLTTSSDISNLSISSLQSSPAVKACLTRLNEMRVAFEKMRPIEKKLRYQIDKLLSLSSGVFAVIDDDDDDNDNGMDKKTGDEEKANEQKSFTSSAPEDPLSFQPNIDEWMGMEDNVSNEQNADSNDEGNADSDVDDDDDDMKAAKSAIESVTKKSSSSTKSVYKPPRLFSTGTDSLTLKEKQEAKEKKQKRRKRQLMSQNSELLHTLRSQYTDMPEEDDVQGGTGGAGTGKGSMIHSSAAKRKFEIRDRNKTEFEEEQFIRLVPTRKEKKERNRVYAEERSNLKEISDLGNLTKGITAFTNENDDNNDGDVRRSSDDGFNYKGDWEGRFANGKRKRGVDMTEEKGGVRRVKEGKHRMRARNPLQKELYGVTSSSGKKKKKSKK